MEEGRVNLRGRRQLDREVRSPSSQEGQYRKRRMSFGLLHE
jgi:hypothetical protein